jgi:hypothetical protein
MYNNEIKEYNIYELNSQSGITWFNIDELNSHFKISKTIIKKRIKNNPNLLIQDKTIHSIKSKKGKPTNYFHISILNDLLGTRNKPRNFKIKLARRTYIGTSTWDYIGTILPERSTINDLKNKMRFLLERLETKLGKRKGLKLFYSIEPNTEDKYYHCHFLIYSKTKSIDISLLKNELEIIAGDKTKDRTPYLIKPYDYMNFGFSGSFYSFKDKSVFDEYMM